jgi:aerobic-type carbon monoxide dehydrogenase small subunit (CoxS/CutS family)
MTEEKKKKTVELSRREFLKDAGLLVGGTAIGSTVILAACGGGETETVTDTITRTQTNTVTSTVPGPTQTITSTTTVGAGQTATVTETTTATQSRFVCPSCGMEFVSLNELQNHFTAEHPEGIPNLVTLRINGESRIVQVEPDWTLAFVIREKLGLTGTKVGCDRGDCGTCTVIVDGKSVYSCLMLAIEAEGKDIWTIEGLSYGTELHAIQQAFIDHDALQCGYCIPGFIMSAKSLLDYNSAPTFDEVREALSGHYCSCGLTKRIVSAVFEGGK